METQTIEELLPFYVNGTLDDEERDLVEQALENNEALLQQVEVLRHIRREIRLNDAQTSTGEFGLARLMNEINADAQPEPANETKPPLFRISALSATAAAAVVALAFFAGTIFQPKQPVYLQASGENPSGTIAVRFQPDVSQKLLAETLVSQGLIIVDGPSAQGFYRLETFDEGDLQAIIENLRVNAAVFEFVDAPQ